MAKNFDYLKELSLFTITVVTRQRRSARLTQTSQRWVAGVRWSGW